MARFIEMTATRKNKSPMPCDAAVPTAPAMPTGPATCERFTEKVKICKKKLPSPTAVMLMSLSVNTVPADIDSPSESGTVPRGVNEKPSMALCGYFDDTPVLGFAVNVRMLFPLNTLNVTGSFACDEMNEVNAFGDCPFHEEPAAFAEVMRSFDFSPAIDAGE